MLDKNGIARRIAKEVKDGYYVNLGIGIPTLVANFVRDDISVEFQSENGDVGALTVKSVKYIVVRRTWNSVCMVSKFRREGIVICSLPAGMLLVCAFHSLVFPLPFLLPSL